MKEIEALELLKQVEPGMVLVDKKDSSLLIVRELDGGKYLCISEDNEIVITDLLKELKSEENIVGIYALPDSQGCANQNAFANGVREIDDEDEDMYWNNGAIQRTIWLSVPKEEAEDKPELPAFLQMLEKFLTILFDDSSTERVKIVPFEEDGKIGLRMILRVPKK